jgi:uncharacterized protein YjcR
MKKGRRKSPIPPFEIRTAFDLFLDRVSQKHIAKRLNVSPMTIHRWAKKYKWKEKREDYIKAWTDAIINDKIKTAQRGYLF